MRNPDARAARAVLGRRHAQARIHSLIDAADGPEPRREDRLQDVVALAKLVLQGPQAAGFLKLPRGHADQGFERALEMEGAQSRFLAE